MTRKHLERSPIFPYHVTLRSNNREWFYLPQDEIWRIVCDCAFTVNWVYMARIHAIVLMSNHIHIMLSTPCENLDQIMLYFTRELSKGINRKAGRINCLFSSRYKWSLIQSSDYYANCLRYIYQNPTRAEICKRVEDYPYSTLRSILGIAPLKIPLHAPLLGHFTQYVPQDFEMLVNWLNIGYSKQEILFIRKALRRFEYQYPNKMPKKILKQLQFKSAKCLEYTGIG